MTVDDNFSPKQGEMSEGQKGSDKYQVASIETLYVGVGSPDPRAREYDPLS
jgi:hypothetical protein